MGLPWESSFIPVDSEELLVRDSVAAALVICVSGLDGVGLEPYGGAVLGVLAVCHLMVAAIVLDMLSKLLKLRAQTAVRQVSLLDLVLQSGDLYGTLLIRVHLDFEFRHG